MTWAPATSLAKVVHAAGFSYDPVQDSLYSRMNAWQRQAGFCWAYDVASAPLHMIIDCETFYFWYDRKPWLIELWKGQYGLETGAEIGVYCENVGVAHPFTDPRSRFYRICVPLKMKWQLYRNKARFLYREKTDGESAHWWLTGFRWGVFTKKSADLTMELEIECLTPAMRDAFNEAVMKKGYPDAARGHKSVAFTFEKPKTVQPENRKKLEGNVQEHNQALVDGYNLIKVAKGIETNDPNEFTDEVVQGVVREVAGKAATEIRKKALPAAKAVQGKAAAFANTIQKKKSPVTSKVQNKVAAVRDKLEGLPAEAKSAYGEIFTFFDKKVWHVTR
jgi:hypothetical protein